MSDTQEPKPMHRRSIEHQTRLHETGVLEIESRLIDTKAYDTHVGFGRPLGAGEPVHDMTIRILVGPDMLIRDIQLRMDSTPFEICPEVIQRFEKLKGISIGKGWNAQLSQRFAGTGGCRHLVDLLRGMATVAFQSMARSDWTPEALAWVSNSCHAFDQKGPVMRRLVAEMGDSKNLNNK
jgi:hypothetical protein